MLYTLESLHLCPLACARCHFIYRDYLLSRPIVFPHGYANFGIGHGSLRAALNFPSAFAGHRRYLIEVSDLNATQCRWIDPKQKSCNENVDIVDILFDCTRVAWGGLSINSTMGANIGPDMYFVNFIKAGVTVNGGHEVMLHEAWLGATFYSTKNHTQSEAGSTAIEILGNDHIVSDVIVFGGQTGVLVTGGANLIEGVHTWNDGTHAASPGWGIVISNTQSVRILNCYLDYTALRIEGPNHISVADSFFLGGATIVLAPRTDNKLPAGVVGTVLTDNTWENFNMPTNNTVVVDERASVFDTPIDFIMSGNIGCDSMTPKAITITKSLRKPNSTTWDFDFSGTLLFPHLPITNARYSLMADAGFVRHVSRPPNGPSLQQISVVTDAPISGTVTMTVSQGMFTAGNGW